MKKNPSISFRVNEFHLARALNIIRQLEPSYQIISPSHIVKTCFFDYIAKMNLNRDPNVPPHIITELNAFLNNPNKTQSIDLDSFIDQQEQFEKAEISSVTDFSPPDDWKE